MGAVPELVGKADSGGLAYRSAASTVSLLGGQEDSGCGPQKGSGHPPPFQGVPAPLYLILHHNHQHLKRSAARGSA